MLDVLPSMISVRYHRGLELPEHGLWLDPAALLRGDLMAVFQIVQQGLASPEHAAFVTKLQQEAAGKAP